MRAFEIMSTNVETIPAETAAEAAREIMRRKAIRHLVVVKDGEVVGVVSDRDIGRHGAATRAYRTAGHLMTAAPVTVSPETTVRKIANLMRGRTIGCVPVLNRQRLVGIVTVADLLTLLGRGTDRPVQATRPPLHYRVPHRKATRAPVRW
jgi:acetoin utilization protein AcuB